MWNYAFIDWQNLHLWVTADWWDIDLNRLRILLKDKFKVVVAYYYIGYSDPNNFQLYQNLKNAGFIVIFKKQSKQMISQKKWNIDSDLIFDVMKLLQKWFYTFDKVLIISGDWDFKILVDHLISENKLEKIIFPNKKFASSMYRNIPNMYKDYIRNHRLKIEK